MSMLTKQCINFSGYAIKTADEDEFLVPELAEFVKNLKPKEDHVYLHVVALGSGEHWGANTRNDYFPEVALRGGYPDDTVMETINKANMTSLLPKEWGLNTFMGAHIFLHHKNNDVKYSVGDVLVVAYNTKMRRVECVISLDKQRCFAIDHPDGRMYYTKAINEEKLKFSMGCHVPFDRCVICQNLARSSKQYCSHVKNAYTTPFVDGRRVYVINDFPVFFDLSIVTRPADASAWQLRKVAEDAEDKYMESVNTAADHLKGVCCPLEEAMKALKEDDPSVASAKSLAGGILTHPMPKGVHSVTISIDIEKVAIELPKSLLIKYSLFSPLFDKTAGSMEVGIDDVRDIADVIDLPIFGAAVRQTGMRDIVLSKTAQLKDILRKVHYVR